MTLGQYAPWFFGSGDGEPFSYRAWKWLWQKRSSVGWTGDLLERIESTDWDLLIVLDACRYDTLAQVADTVVVERAVSPVSATYQFLEVADQRGTFEDAVYVSANPQTRKLAPVPEEQHVDISDSKWDDFLQTVPPAPVYRAAFQHIDDDTPVVAHTLQPHYPHICSLEGDVVPVPGGLHPKYLEFFDGDPLQIQAILAAGKVDFVRARRSYRAATKFAWDIARAAAARAIAEGYTVCITADHGELFGEWGFVEHPVDVAIHELVGVPWVTIHPRTDPSPDTERSVSERLASLGYIE